MDLTLFLAYFIGFMLGDTLMSWHLRRVFDRPGSTAPACHSDFSLGGGGHDG